MSEVPYRQAKEQIAQLEAELAEFQASSRELEKELELELEESEQKHKNLTNQVESLTGQVNEWKGKHLELQKEYSANQTALLKQIATLKEKHFQANERLREIETTNDDMEQHERITKSSLAELEQKYHNCLEDIAMLESEVASKDEMQIELQRTKDDLRDTKEELSVAQTRINSLTQEKEQLEASNNDLKRQLANSSPIMKKNGFRITSDPYAATSHVNATAPSPSNSPSSRETVSFQRMSSSKSLRKIHGMLDQMRNLEYRVAHFKSSLPKPSSPSTHSRNSSTSSTPSTGSPRTVSKRASVDGSPIDANSPNHSQLPIASLRRSSSILDRQFLLESTRSSPPLLSAAVKKRGTSKSHISERDYVRNTHLEAIEGSPSTNQSGLGTDITSRKPPQINLKSKTSVSNAVESYDKMIKPDKRADSPELKPDAKVFNRPGSAFSALHKRTSIGHGRFV